MMSIRGLLFSCLAVCALQPAHGQAQGRVRPPPVVGDGPVQVVPGPRYAAGSFQRFFLGSGWRDLWLRPLEVPTLPVDTFAGGLTPEKEGGNKQSKTLHFVDAEGKGWVFRSLDKYPAEKLDDGLEGTPTGALIQDQISAMHPTGQLVLPPLLEALGILHVEPVLVVMPDDARLGEFRETFAGMVGALERKPNEGENDTPGFAGSRKIRDTSDFLNDLRESHSHAVADREFLRARLLDFIVGDTDRGGDQYGWARFPHPEDDGRVLWRPIPRDRDWSLHRPDGLIAATLAPMLLPKFTPFGPEHSSVNAHTVSTHDVDRPLLTALDRDAFREEVTAVRNALTDAVIETAVQRLPDSYPASHARLVADALKCRRDDLATIANAYYEQLATDVDVHGTDEPDHARLTRHVDGSLEVSLSARAVVVAEPEIQDGNGSGPRLQPQVIIPWYRRVFLPGETHEVRVFLHDGDDIAVVHGPESPITIRIIGGDDDDVLADSSGTGRVHLYDADGDNRIVTTARTSFDDSEWNAPATDHLVIHRHASDWAPDWGGGRGWGADLSHGTAEGVVVGYGPTFTNYGFRRLPYHWRIDGRLHSGLREFTPGVSLAFDYRMENAPHSIEMKASWPGYDSFRWFGLGNDTEPLPREAALVRMDRLEIESALIWRFGAWRRVESGDTAEETTAEIGTLRALRGAIGAGPIIRRSATEPGPGGLFAVTRPLGFDPFWQAGSRVELELQQTDADAVPQRGYRLKTRVEGFPGVLDLPGAYGTAAAELNGYVPVTGGLHLAARLGAIRAFGEVPAFDVATIGGQRTLRGYPSRRFAGDAATYGGIELRVPLGRVPLIAPASLGVFALGDAGRVWEDGASPGGWHTAWGGGLWLAVAERAVSAAWARGERGTLHVWLGMPF
jgi:hypothetical protein